MPRCGLGLVFHAAARSGWRLRGALRPRILPSHLLHGHRISCGFRLCETAIHVRTVLRAVTAGHSVLLDPVPARCRRLVAHRRRSGRARRQIEYCWLSVYALHHIEGLCRVLLNFFFPQRITNLNKISTQILRALLLLKTSPINALLKPQKKIGSISRPRWHPRIEYQ